MQKKALVASGILGLAVTLGAFFVNRPDTAHAISRCKHMESQLTSPCYDNIIKRELDAEGLPRTLKLVAAITAVDKNFSDQCHTKMHDLGRDAYTMYHNDGDIQLDPTVSYCGYGFFHGFMEEMARVNGNIAEAKAFCTAVGKKLINQSAAESNCYHGIGHGTTDGSDPSTWGDPVAMVSPGLVMCREATKNVEYLGSCYMGAFNSIELLYPDPKYRLDAHGHPFTLCKEPKFSDEEKKACYTEMSVLTMTMVRGDFTKGLAFAHDAAPAFTEYATRFLAVYSFATVDTDPLKVLAACRKIVPSTLESCIRGIAEGLKVYGKPNYEYEPIAAFCTNKALSKKEQHMCADYALASDSTGAEGRRAVCDLFPKDMQGSQCVKIN